MAKPSGDYAISELIDIAQRYLKAYKTAQSNFIEEYGGSTVNYELKALKLTTDQDSRRIEYLRTIIEEERTNDHDTTEPAEPNTAATDTATATAADAAHFVRYDGTGAGKQA